MRNLICFAVIGLFTSALWAQTPQEKAQNAAVRNMQLQRLQQLAQSKPGAKVTVQSEYIGKPLPDLVKYADIIVYGRIIGDSNSYEYSGLAHHNYAVQVLQVIKGTNVPATVSFPQVGGDLYFSPNQWVHFDESSSASRAWYRTVARP